MTLNSVKHNERYARNLLQYVKFYKRLYSNQSMLH